MSTQSSIPHPEASSSPPGIALVRSLAAPAPLQSSVWERWLLRLCIGPLPLIWAVLHEAALRASDAPHTASAADLRFLVAISFTWITAIEGFHATRCEKINREHTGAMAVLVSVCVAMCVASLLLAMLGIPLPGFLSCAAEGAFLFFASAIVKISLQRTFHTQSRMTRVYVVDAHTHRGELAWVLTRKRVSRHEIFGAIRLEEQESSNVTKIFRNLDDLVREIQREPADGVLISASSAQTSHFSRHLSAFDRVDAPVRFIVDPGEGSAARRIFADSNSIYLLNLGAVPEKTLHYLILKRAFDVAFSLAAIVVGMPLIALIAIAVKLTSKGKVIFVQNRVGWNGRVFRMYKFRTMRTAPPAESDTHWSQPNDARRTPLGKILRKYSLDEIPQFFNVLMGDMSVVGPRPERPYFVNNFRREIGEYHRRHQIKVGLTGWAQVNGLRGDTCIRIRLMHDLYYLQNWGLIFDLRIVLRTVLCVLRGRDDG